MMLNGQKHSERELCRAIIASSSWDDDRVTTDVGFFIFIPNTNELSPFRDTFSERR